jgi:hypothetical protein
MPLLLKNKPGTNTDGSFFSRINNQEFFLPGELRVILFFETAVGS